MMPVQTADMDPLAADTGTVTDHNQWDTQYKMMIEHYDTVFRTACILGNDQHTAQDLTQETFSKVMEAVTRGRSIRNSRAYLLTALRNLFYRHLSRNQARPVDKDDLEGYIAHHADDDIHPALQVSSADLIAKINNLHDRFKEPLVLYYYNELSYKEIAGILDIPVGTVMSRLSRAKRYLKLKLADVMPSES